MELIRKKDLKRQIAVLEGLVRDLSYEVKELRGEVSKMKETPAMPKMPSMPEKKKKTARYIDNSFEPKHTFNPMGDADDDR